MLHSTGRYLPRLRLSQSRQRAKVMAHLITTAHYMGCLFFFPPFPNFSVDFPTLDFFCTYHLAHTRNSLEPTSNPSLDYLWCRQLIMEEEKQNRSLFFYVLPLCCHCVETHIFKNSRRLTLAAEQEMNVWARVSK